MGGFEGVVCKNCGDFVSTYIFKILSSLAQAIISVYSCVCAGVNVFVLLILKNAYIIMQIVLAVIVLCQIILKFSYKGWYLV